MPCDLLANLLSLISESSHLHRSSSIETLNFDFIMVSPYDVW